MWCNTSSNWRLRDRWAKSARRTDGRTDWLGKAAQQSRPAHTEIAADCVSHGPISSRIGLCTRRVDERCHRCLTGLTWTPPLRTAITAALAVARLVVASIDSVLRLELKLKLYAAAIAMRWPKIFRWILYILFVRILCYSPYILVLYSFFYFTANSLLSVSIRWRFRQQ